jgi:hypothetical protein
LEGGCFYINFILPLGRLPRITGIGINNDAGNNADNDLGYSLTGHILGIYN